jgi:hypothetical protein
MLGERFKNCSRIFSPVVQFLGQSLKSKHYSNPGLKEMREINPLVNSGKQVTALSLESSSPILYSKTEILKNCNFFRGYLKKFKYDG